MAVFTQMRELLTSVTEVTTQHLRLARLELEEDARFIGRRVGVIAALAPLILVGYGFICVALALALRRVLSADLAFLLVGLANLVGGVAGIAWAAKALQRRQVMGTTLTELKTTSAVVLRTEGKP
jgi:succinate-acetate transporter protein